MLEQTRQALATGRVILASGSSRKQEVLKQMGLQNIEIVPSLYVNNLDPLEYLNCGKYSQDVAKNKVLEVYNRLKEDSKAPSLIIGLHTMVTSMTKIYEKPKDKSEAFEMLSSLANKTHTVSSGVCLRTQKETISFYESTKVKFGDISAEQIVAYIDTGEPLDKAGAYILQGLGGSLIEKIEGDLYTVTVGMPLYSITQQLNKLFSNI